MKDGGSLMILMKNVLVFCMLITVDDPKQRGKKMDKEVSSKTISNYIDINFVYAHESLVEKDKRKRKVQKDLVSFPQMQIFLYH